MRAIILPGGHGYTPAMPLLEFARRSLVQHGYDVLPVWWDASAIGDDPDGWVRDQVVDAVGDDEQVLVVGKSLGTRAASYAAERRWPAIWLTPLLDEPTCVAGIRANPARQLLVGGLEDRYWDTDTASTLVGELIEVVEVPGADHALCVPDAVRSAEIQVDVTRAFHAFLPLVPSRRNCE